MSDVELEQQKRSANLVLMTLLIPTILYPVLTLLVSSFLMEDVAEPVPKDTRLLIGVALLVLALASFLINQLFLLPKARNEREKNPIYAITPMILSEFISFYGLAYSLSGVFLVGTIDWTITGILYLWGFVYGLLIFSEMKF